MPYNSFTSIIELLGTIAFTISGVFAAMQKRLDLFGVLIMGFVTAIGGGTIRDVLIGVTPVSWMLDLTTLGVIITTGIITVLFKKTVKNLKVTLFFFDALGLGLFTVIGMQKGVAKNLHPVICVALGTITGCFGGVIRDILLNQIPMIFRRKEIYATACIIGGVIYWLSLVWLDERLAQTIAVIVICTIRIVAVKLNWKLPAV
ncbi:trimeric intracellular cation channel family protein [Mucilaginibacter robiniae]|uniref:Trimeric intracellular cation channel family protein n=1 Tax=Mucilaginibacter robiniae TaxID=2728022 RepID=A0A7L5E5E3_9SPHI|nr:trimeric intracellular cation channel family protein [Mucilaginibacter robiniae]QJD97607.1 trimeric intracellular cation channel family protein [Mucilaginibacter robiniae]